jgi:hypothetical protein
LKGAQRRSDPARRVFAESMRRAVAILTLLAVLVLPALAAARHERVKVRPARLGDVNTRFVYRGSGWRPGARLSLSHGVLCGTGPCILPLFFRIFHADSQGRFRVSEHPARAVVSDFGGYSVCFAYAERSPGPGGKCRALRRITVVPPWASATPVVAERFAGNPPSLGPIVTFAAQHFRAGERLKVRIRYPDGRRRVLSTRARRHGAYVGPAAFAPRGGAIRLYRVRASDPDGTYRVRVTNVRGDQARTSYVVKTTSP